MENLKKEKTLVLLKPDTVQRALIGEVISRFERVGLKIVAMKFLLPTKEQAYKHYVKNEAEIEALGNRSVAITRKMVGSTEPLQSNMGTIRGDDTVDSYAIADEGDRSVRNLVHASANLEE